MCKNHEKACINLEILFSPKGFLNPENTQKFVFFFIGHHAPQSKFVAKK